MGIQKNKKETNSLNEHMDNKPKKKITNKFKVFILAYSGLLIAGVIVVLTLLYGLLKDYENSIPANVMDSLITQFRTDNVDELLKDNPVEISEFESQDIVSEYLKDTLTDTAVSYKKKSGEYNSNNPVYCVLADEKIIAKVTLAQNGKNSHKFNTWKLGNISFGAYIESDNEVEIIAPGNAQVCINGIAVSDTYIVEEGIVIDRLKNVTDYVEVPTNTKYKISNLMGKPIVTATLDGKELEYTQKDDKIMVKYPTDSEFQSEQEANIIAVGQEYGKYIINRGSLRKLNTYLIGSAKEYMSDIPAIWAYLYGKQYTYEFRNHTIKNLQIYTDSCFSCEVHYDLYVDWTTGNKNYDTNMIYTFIKQNDKWYLADFSIN